MCEAPNENSNIPFFAEGSRARLCYPAVTHPVAALPQQRPGVRRCGSVQAVALHHDRPRPDAHGAEDVGLCSLAVELEQIALGQFGGSYFGAIRLGAIYTNRSGDHRARGALLHIGLPHGLGPIAHAVCITGTDSKSAASMPPGAGATSASSSVSLLQSQGIQNRRVPVHFERIRCIHVHDGSQIAGAQAGLRQITDQNHGVELRKPRAVTNRALARPSGCSGDSK